MVSNSPTSKLQEEIKQGKPFESLREELFLNLSRTAAIVGHRVEQGLRPHGLSLTQYNVLRILRGAGPDGLCQYEIGDRLVAQMPDVPRIVDRMVKAGWVERSRGAKDRRMVMTRLTAVGLALVNALDRPMGEINSEVFLGMSDGELRRLNELLVAARTCSKSSCEQAESGPPAR
jgi:DNA-binding MarR family transcriptional regulator